MSLRLLERLRYCELPLENKPDEASLELDSIFRHIKSLISTRKGTVPISEEFGMPDVFFSFGINYEVSSRRMRDSIAELICTFETRLKNVAVKTISTRQDLLKQQFKITAVLTKPPCKHLEFIVEVSSEGNISILLENDRV